MTAYQEIRFQVDDPVARWLAGREGVLSFTQRRAPQFGRLPGRQEDG